MSAELHDDLRGVTEGSLSRDELVARHGAHSASLVDLHTELSALATVEIEPPPWYVIAPALGIEPRPAKRSRRRVTIVSIVAAFVLIPAVAEGLEAVAPDAVRGTVIDRITDVFPWDKDLPATDVDRQGPSDQRDLPDEPPVGDSGPESDSTDDPAGDRAVVDQRREDRPSVVRETDVDTETVRERESITDRIERGDRDRLVGDRDQSDRETDSLQRPTTSIAPTRDATTTTAVVDQTPTTVSDAPATTLRGSDTTTVRTTSTTSVPTTTTTSTTTSTIASDRVDDDQ